MTENRYATEMARGEESLGRRDYESASRHFRNAHALGHNVSCRHIEAHKGLLRLGWKTRSISAIASQLFLIAAAALFDRPAVRR